MQQSQGHQNKENQTIEDSSTWATALRFMRPSLKSIELGNHRKSFFFFLLNILLFEQSMDRRREGFSFDLGFVFWSCSVKISEKGIWRSFELEFAIIRTKRNTKRSKIPCRSWSTRPWDHDLRFKTTMNIHRRRKRWNWWTCDMCIYIVVGLRAQGSELDSY